MIAFEQIRQLPLQEKIAIMGAIWEDLSAEESAVEVPQWHQELLGERERLLADGKAHSNIRLEMEITKAQGQPTCISAMLYLRRVSP
jgi:hypothetical protein